MDHLTFTTKQEAEEFIRTMRGYDAHAVRILVPTGNSVRPAWVIEILGMGDSRYVRKDGYVR